KLLEVLYAPRNLSGPVAFLPDGKTLAAVHGPRVALWPLDGRPAPAWYDSPPSRLAFAGPDRLVTGSVDPHEPLTVWDAATGGPRRLLGQGYGSKEFDVSPDGRLVALTSEAGLCVWDIEKGRELLSHKSPVSSPHFAADGRSLWLVEGAAVRRRALADGA